VSEQGETGVTVAQTQSGAVPLRARIRRALPTALVCLGVLVTALCGLLVVGAWRNDVAIETPVMGEATAEVVSVSFPRTVVRYNTPDGSVHIPPLGVLYPEGLQVGQLVRVEYDVERPDDLVRVAGRDVRYTLLPVGSALLVWWGVLAPLVWWARRVARR